MPDEHTALEAVEPEQLLDLPVEILRKIFCLLPEDLEIVPCPADIHIGDQAKTALARTVNKMPWRCLMLGVGRVSKRFKQLLSDAIEWQASQKNIDLVVDTTKFTFARFPRPGTQGFDLSSTDLDRASRYIPQHILGHFSSIRMTIPVRVMSAQWFPDDEALMLFDATLQKSSQKAGFYMTGSCWTTLRPAKEFGSTLRFAQALETFEDMFRTSYILRLQQQASAMTVLRFATVLGLHTAHWSSSGPGYTIQTTRSACVHYRLEKARQEQIGCRTKLGWRGSPPDIDPGAADMGISFLTKWKPCAQLICNRRTKKAKLVKLGWHGSRIIADGNCQRWDAVVDARSKAQEPDADDIVDVADWVSTLDVTAEVKQDSENHQTELRKSFDPIRNYLVRLSMSTVKKTPYAQARKKRIMTTLVVISDRINKLAVDHGDVTVVEEMWEYVANHHLPVSSGSRWGGIGQYFMRLVRQSRPSEPELILQALEPLKSSLQNALKLNKCTNEDEYGPDWVRFLERNRCLQLSIIGSNIKSQVAKERYRQLEDKIWDHVAVVYWAPLSLSGSELRQKYEKSEEATLDKLPKIYGEGMDGLAGWLEDL